MTDIIEAIERVRSVAGKLSLDEFEASWENQWLVERGILIISEASRHLSNEIKTRHPDIPWAKVAGIGSVLRHDYERIASDVIWKLATADLPALEAICRAELVRD
ncbi:MAG: HepT-like ribonuclease domain-containing protein [Xanthobacteraceae bacterium]